jgi:undecaprenyl diphosphate synthase
MDGNRRWAHDRSLAAAEGHAAGAGTLREIVRASASAGIEILTVFGFSEENRRREPAEIAQLMDLMRRFAERERAGLVRENVRVRLIGRIDELPAPVRAALDALRDATAGSDGLLLNLALNYGSRAELCDAVRALANDVAAGRIAPEAIAEDTLAHYLYTAGLPDPDLLIRTGGELRLSNFLLYQCAYTELWSTPVHWPNFTASMLRGALDAFSKRQRRFGT